MNNEKLQPVLKWGLYALLLVVLYALQTTPNLFQIGSAKPVLVVSFAVCVSMYEGVMASAMFSLAAGLLWDLSSDKVFGFNGLILMLCGMMISLLCIYYFHTKPLNSMMFCAVVLFLQNFFNYIFYYAIWNHENSAFILGQNLFPMLLYTVAVTPLFFFLVRWIESRLNPVVRA